MSSSRAWFAAVLFAAGAWGGAADGLRAEDLTPPPVAASWSDPLVEVSASVGMMRGDSHELVYDSAGRKRISKLFWTFDENAVIGAGVAVSPMAGLTLGLKAWTNATDDSTMDDYDWLIPGFKDWSDWSHHERTNLEWMVMADLGASLDLYTSNGVTVRGLAGYRWDNWKWKAFDGSFIYSTFGLRDTTGTFDGLGIAYEQWFETPYLGLGLDLRQGPWTFSASAVGSAWVTGHDEDTHYFRGVVFTEEYDGGEFAGVDLSASYALNDSWTLTGSWHFQKYWMTKAPTEMLDVTTGQTFVFPGDAGGADHQSEIFSLGATFRLN